MTHDGGMDQSKEDAFVADAFGVDPGSFASAPAAMPLEGGAGAASGDGGAVAAAGDQKLILTDSTEPPTSINADTLADFINGSNAVLGGNPHCNISPSTSFYIDAAGICTGVIVTIETAIVRPRLGLSRAQGKERDLIQKAVVLIADHENTHRSIVRTALSSLPADMLGKTEKNATKVLNAAIAKEDAAQKALDAAHGRLVIVKDATGAPADVTTGPL